MKKTHLIALPLSLLMAGCNAPADNNAANANSAGTASATATQAAPSPKTTATQNDNAPADGAKATGDNAPDPKYKVVSEADPRMPAGLIAALEKAQVLPPPKKPDAPKRARVVMETSKGNITVELNGEAAPLHVKSFLYLANRDFYNGTVFHRYEPGFVIQGGDPLSKNEATKEYAGMGGPGYQVPRERNSLKHEKMVIAAARSQDPNSAGSQFYFTLEPAPFLDEGDGYTVFGKVVSGQDVVAKLRAGDKLKKVEVQK
jgi:cyclophilin family peptidyl-prolyl cis-trans isomerase